MRKNIVKIIAVITAVMLVAFMAVSCGTRASAEEPEHTASDAQLETVESAVMPQSQEKQEEQAPIGSKQAGEADAIVVEGKLEENAEAQTSGETVDLGLFPTGDNFMKPHSIDGIDINGKIVALTMDDGPSANTPEVLDILKDEGVKATFFVIGENIAGKEDILKREYDEGHEIAGHSWDHKSFTKLDFDTLMNEQISKTNDAIEAATGKRSIMDRPPGGAITEELAAKMQRPQILWSSDSEDWKFKRDMEKDAAISAATDKAMGEIGDGGVILWHDLHNTAPAIARNLISQLKADGYQFVTISQLMQIAKLRGEDVGFLFSRAPKAGAEAAKSEDGTNSGEEEKAGSDTGDGDQGDYSASDNSMENAVPDGGETEPADDGN